MAEEWNVGTLLSTTVRLHNFDVQQRMGRFGRRPGAPSRTSLQSLLARAKICVRKSEVALIKMDQPKSLIVGKRRRFPFLQLYSAIQVFDSAQKCIQLVKRGSRMFGEPIASDAQELGRDRQGEKTSEACSRALHRIDRSRLDLGIY